MHRSASSFSTPGLRGILGTLLAQMRTQDCYFCGMASPSALCTPCSEALARLPAARSLAAPCPRRPAPCAGAA